MSKALNELKKATMAAYLAKAGGRVRSGTKIGLDFQNDAYKDMAIANKHHPNMITPGFEKDPEKLKSAEARMNVNMDLAKTFKRDAANRIKGIARAGRLLAKEEITEETLKEYKNTESHPSLWDTHQLVHKSGKVLKKGDKVKTSDGTHKIVGFELPHHSGSTGRVYVHDKQAAFKMASYFPGVVDSKIVAKKAVKEDAVNEANHTHQVVYTVPGEGKQKQYYHVTADDESHAREQLMDAEPKAKIHKVEPIAKNEEVVNEVSRSTIAKVATARYNQAQDALKKKDFGGYVKKMGKAIKAADKTTPNVGWSPEDDTTKKNEEVVAPVVSAQEKYRQIKEAKVKKAVKKDYASGKGMRAYGDPPKGNVDYPNDPRNPKPKKVGE